MKFNAETMTGLSNVVAWISTGIAVVYGIKKTGSAKCLLGFTFPMLIHSSISKSVVMERPNNEEDDA